MQFPREDSFDLSLYSWFSIFLHEDRCCPFVFSHDHYIVFHIVAHKLIDILTFSLNMCFYRRNSRIAKELLNKYLLNKYQSLKMINISHTMLSKINEKWAQCSQLMEDLEMQFPCYIIMKQIFARENLNQGHWCRTWYEFKNPYLFPEIRLHH